MRRLLSLAIVLGACTTARTSQLDGATELATTFCNRLHECGFFLDEDVCVAQVVSLFCPDAMCAGDVPSEDGLDRCLEALVLVTCERYAFGDRPAACLGAI